MRILKYSYLLAIAALTVIMAACSSESADEITPDNPAKQDQLTKVQLHVSSASFTRTRTVAWSDANAQDEEMMNIWVVAIVNNSTNALEHVIACKPTGTSREIDADLELPKGTEYRFYSFANMSTDKVKTLLASKGTDIAFTLDMTGVANDVQNAATGVTGTLTTAQANSITATVNGNGFAAFTSTDDNGFSSYGIPMSNVQTLTIPNSGSATIDLVVVRMVAKIELQIKNETGASLTVNQVTLSNITQNGNDILTLLPSLTQHNTMEPTHKDIQPNLGTVTQDNFTTYIGKSIANDATETVTFYVNESATPTNAEGLFYLTLEVENAGTSEFRYALISNNTDNEWNYIARNDYRIIPIVLDDLKFEIIPYDFPPIGVYPCSVKEIDAANHVYDFEFHDYGHFHLLPTVTKGGAAIAFTATTPTGTDYKWGLVDNDWSKSWFTYAKFGDDTQTANPGDFYRTGSGSTTADGDDEGQLPVWYVNDGVAGPQWDPAASANYRPFIFGYIEDPGIDYWGKDPSDRTAKRIYHEMRIQVYNGTSAYRQMLYRFYMTLSPDQMLGAPALGTPAPRRSHGH